MSVKQRGLLLTKNRAVVARVEDRVGLATKSDDLYLISGTHMVDGEKN